MRRHLLGGLRAIGLVAGLGSMLASSAWAQSGGAPFIFDTSKPINVAADRLEVDNKLQVVRWLGNVVAVQDTAMLNADMVTITYERETKKAKAGTEAETSEAGVGALTGTGSIKMITASGSVIMTQADRKALCEQVVFDQQHGTVTMTGNPRLYSGSDELKGAKIRLFIDSERVEVLGSANQRVQATVQPDNVKQSLPPDAVKRLEDLQENPPPRTPPDEEG
ncbi:MAG: lipopolysaccharide transport periplasmic protein LptA [Deltaproteobacteria bacterium]|nr:lipopolysaccharide transport periplasmic protein LptA [Deltaproteobacteria bacterium]